MRSVDSTLSWLLAVALVSGCDRAAPDAAKAPRATANSTDLAPAVPVPAAAGAPGPASGAASIFTSLDPARCQLIERNDEEAGYARHRCPGPAGYRVEMTESDLRQDFALLRPDGSVNKLDLNALVAGGGFSSLGKTAEWRGVAGKPPRTLTVRFGVNEDPDPKIAPRSYLVVVRLATPACVVARISPGPKQSDEARAIADQASSPPMSRRCLNGAPLRTVR